MTSELLQKLGVTERDLIWAVVSAMFFSDFGVVKSVSSDKKRVDVEHAIQPVIADQQQDARRTVNVELLWPASAELSMRWDIAAGDTVLLVGLKDYVKDADGSLPGKTTVGLHYTQETMKAIPLGSYSASSEVLLNVSGGLVQLKNTATSLYTILNNLMSAVNTFSNAAAQSAITTGGASSVALAAAINVLLSALNVAVINVTTLLGQLLKA
jgi:hypothetical protein